MILGHKRQREITQANPEKEKRSENIWNFFLLNPFQSGRLKKDAKYQQRHQRDLYQVPLAHTGDGHDERP
jgi:hypothetical protein